MSDCPECECDVCISASDLEAELKLFNNGFDGMNGTYFWLTISNAVLWIVSSIIMIRSFRAKRIDEFGGSFCAFIMCWIGTILHTIFIIFGRYESECRDGLGVHGAYAMARILLCWSISCQMLLIYIHVQRIGYEYRRKAVVRSIIVCCFLIKFAMSEIMLTFMGKSCDWYVGGYIYLTEGTTTTCLTVVVVTIFGDLSRYEIKYFLKTPFLWIGLLLLVLSGILHLALVDYIGKYDELLQFYCVTQAMVMNISNILMGLKVHETELYYREPQQRVNNNATELTEFKQDDMDDTQQNVIRDIDFEEPQTNEALLQDEL